MDQLLKYEFGKIFPGCRLLDIHEYLMEKGVTLKQGDPLSAEANIGAADVKPQGGRSQKLGERAVKYLYHDPCHTPMKTHAPLKVANALMGDGVRLSDRCCGESGTFAAARPDIATQVRFRKQEEIEKGVAALGGGEVKVLTSCPSCLQGLWRYQEDTGVQADYIVVEMARRLLGEHWMKNYIERANNGGIERVLL
jgi:Fe-S oxidoreductase